MQSDRYSRHKHYVESAYHWTRASDSAQHYYYAVQFHPILHSKHKKSSRFALRGVISHFTKEQGCIWEPVLNTLLYTAYYKYEYTDRGFLVQ